METGMIVELGVIASTVALVIATVGLWIATAQVHKDEVRNLTEKLSHANDNATEVAIAAINHTDRARIIRGANRVHTKMNRKH